VIYSLIAWSYVAPYLKRLKLAQALTLLLWVHVVRYCVLYMPVARQEGYAISNAAATQLAIGDLSGAIISMSGFCRYHVKRRHVATMNARGFASRGRVMKAKRYTIRGLAALAAPVVLGATLAASPATAAVTNIASSSTILDVALNIGSFGPVYPAAGSAPPAYDVTNSFGSFSTKIGPLTFSTGLLVDEASGDIATEEGQASSNLASLNIAAGSFFTLTASSVGSEASVDGIPAATGSSTLGELVITVLGSSISIPVNPPPNDVIFEALGVKVTLNQQINDVEGSFGQGITVSAIAVDLDIGLLGVKGVIDIAQSKASISEAAVPEPTTWAMMAIGFVGLAFAYRRKRKVAAIS
jgi:PEP-CTERM motif